MLMKLEETQKSAIIVNAAKQKKKKKENNTFKCCGWAVKAIAMYTVISLTSKGLCMCKCNPPITASILRECALLEHPNRASVALLEIYGAVAAI